jgi:Fe-S-cluster containining protein
MITNALNIAELNLPSLYEKDRSKLKALLSQYILDYLKIGRMETSDVDWVDEMLDYILENGPPEYCLVDVMENAGPDSMSTLLCTDCPAMCCKVSDVISVDFHDLKRMADFLKMPWKKCVKKHIGYVNQEIRDTIKANFEADMPMMKLRNTMPCEFLEDDRCAIYPMRPRACRVFPLIQYKGKGYGFELHRICRYPLNVFITEIVGRAPPELWKEPQPWMLFVKKRSEYTYDDEGLSEMEDQMDRIGAYKKGNEKLWKRARFEYEREYDEGHNA